MKLKYITIFALMFGMASCIVEEEKTDDAVNHEGTTEHTEEVAHEEEAENEEVAEEASTADYSAGEEIYGKTCAACHQANGEGIPQAFPPLANSDYLMEDKMRAIKQVIEGSSGEIVVNGETYNGTMTPQNLSDQEIVDVLNYVYHAWGNDGEEVTLEEVATVKEEIESSK
ncbi:MAG TPA: cytochrome c [Crocinitomix sp.]|nr:cytochrome c [Crocinitomix sp.]